MLQWLSVAIIIIIILFRLILHKERRCIKIVKSCLIIYRFASRAQTGPKNWSSTFECLLRWTSVISFILVQFIRYKFDGEFFYKIIHFTSELQAREIKKLTERKRNQSIQENYRKKLNIKKPKMPAWLFCPPPLPLEYIVTISFCTVVIYWSYICAGQPNAYSPSDGYIDGQSVRAPGKHFLHCGKFVRLCRLCTIRFEKRENISVELSAPQFAWHFLAWVHWEHRRSCSATAMAMSSNSRLLRVRTPSSPTKQSLTWIGSIRALDWIGLGWMTATPFFN